MIRSVVCTYLAVPAVQWQTTVLHFYIIYIIILNMNGDEYYEESRVWEYPKI